MAFVPFASWNSRSITHLANYLSRSLPMNSSDESYFLASPLEPTAFPLIAKPKKITLDATTKAFVAAFPKAVITQRLSELSKRPEFARLDGVRNILAHRLSGRRSVRSWSTLHRDGSYESTTEENWYIPGSNEKLTFDGEMLQR